jgi:hypothetical protein
VRRANIRSRNVLGRIPGSTRPNETILYGGHWDHLGVGRPDARGDSIYNGAVDNATGIAAVIEMARAFAAGPRPERSVVFAAWTAEEKGLLGSSTTRPTRSTRSRPRRGLQHRRARAHRPARDVLVVGYGQSELEDRLERGSRPAARGRARPAPRGGLLLPLRPLPDGQARRADALHRQRARPARRRPAAGRAADAAYRRDRYHQPADEFDAATWRLDGIAQDVAVLTPWGGSWRTRGRGRTTARRPSSARSATRRRPGGAEREARAAARCRARGGRGRAPRSARPVVLPRSLNGGNDSRLAERDAEARARPRRALHAQLRPHGAAQLPADREPEPDAARLAREPLVAWLNGVKTLCT